MPGEGRACIEKACAHACRHLACSKHQARALAVRRPECSCQTPRPLIFKRAGELTSSQGSKVLGTHLAHAGVLSPGSRTETCPARGESPGRGGLLSISPIPALVQVFDTSITEPSPPGSPLPPRYYLIPCVILLCSIYLAYHII